MRRIALAMLAVSCVVASFVVAGTTGEASAAADDPIPGDPSVAVASGTPLPFDGGSSWGDIAVDEAHSHVFVSGGPGTTEVVVADLEGRIVETIPDLAGAAGMLLSADGSTLYVALTDGKAVVAVDTATLAVTTFPAGDRCPRYLAQLGSEIYFTESCWDTDFHVMRLDPSTGRIDPVTLTGEEDQIFGEYAHIAAHPSQPGRLFLADNGYYGGTPSNAVSAFEVDGLTATRVATRVAFDQHVYGLDFLGDGQEVMVVNGDGLTALAPSDLSVIRNRYPWSTFGTSFAVSTSSNYVASNRTNSVGGNSRIVIHDRAGKYVRSYFFDGTTYLGLDGVELVGDRVYAVTWHDDGTIRLHALPDIRTPGPLIWLSGVTRQDRVPVHYDGTATLLGEPLADHELTVWRSGPDGLVELPRVRTAEDGSFVLEDTPPQWGSYRYVIISPSAPGLAPEKVTDSYAYSGVRTVLQLEQPDVFAPGDPLVMRGRLVASPDGEPVAGATITGTRTHDGETTALPPVVTDTDGRFSFQVDDAAPGKHVIDATFEGDAVYLPDTEQRSAWVKHDVVVELVRPDSPYLMQWEPLTLHGRLRTAEGAPLPQQTVHWERRRSEDSRDAYGTVVTGSDGTFTIEGYSGCCGHTRWTAVYLGDESHKAASTEVALPVYEQRPVITITTDRRAYDYDTDATVTVRLPDDADGTVRVFKEPYGQEPQLVAENPSVEGPDATVTLRLTRNTTLRAVYEPGSGSYTYVPGSESSDVRVVPVMRQSVAGSYARDGRVYLVHRRVDPTLRLTTRPSLAGKCVRVRVERRRDGAYRLVKRSTCIRLDDYSKAKWTLKGDPPAGAPFRLRYEWSGNPAYSPRNAAWTYLRFTR